MRIDQRRPSTAEPRRLLDTEGPAAAVLRQYARRTDPDEVERWLRRRAGHAPAAARRLSLRPSPAVAGGLMAALLGLWLFVQPRNATQPHDRRGGAGGSEGASGSELGVGGRRGSRGVDLTARAGAGGAPVSGSGHGVRGRSREPSPVT